MIDFKPGQFYGTPQFGARGGDFDLCALAASGSEHDVHLHTHDDAHFILALSGLYISAARGAGDFVRAPALIFNPPGTTHRDRFVKGVGTFVSVSLLAATEAMPAMIAGVNVRLVTTSPKEAEMATRNFSDMKRRRLCVRRKRTPTRPRRAKVTDISASCRRCR